jgi:hypothetical protein
MAYLVWYLAQRSPGDQAKVSIAFDDGESRAALRITSRTARVAADELERLLDPIQVVEHGLSDMGPAVSRRLIAAQGGQLDIRRSRQEIGFLVTLVRSTA